MTHRLYQALLALALTRGAWKGTRRALQRKRPATLANVQAILKETWTSPTLDKLWEDSHIHLLLHKEWAARVETAPVRKRKSGRATG